MVWVCVWWGETQFPHVKKNTLKTPSLHRYISFDQPKVLLPGSGAGVNSCPLYPPGPAIHHAIHVLMIIFRGRSRNFQ